MREYRFRGKRKDNGDLAYGDLVHISYKTYIKDANDKYTNPRVLNDINNTADVRCVEVEPETVGQYIGRKDKNKKEIYEGDICKFVILPGEEKSIPLQALLVVIEWDRGCWGFRHVFPELVHEDDRKWSAFYRRDNDDWDTNYFEVIGNVYEHPNLLGKEAHR